MKIAVLVSGGVDSSVALRLLKNDGHDITAFYLKIWLEDELSYLGDCPWEQDLAYVRQVCAQAGVPLEVVSLQKEYHDQVVAYTIAQVRAGRTPSPDILCNKRIKFGAFFEKIDSSYEKIATGHYAQVTYNNGYYRLLRSPDPVKDQSYFLSHLNQQQLSRLLFPIGHLEKPQVRILAQEYDLPNKDRKDSQGICFLGKLKFRDFIKHYVGEKTGSMIEVETGAVVGHHTGYWFYTIGQRQGIGLSGGPWYVVSKDTQRNIVYISRNYYDADKSRDSLVIEECNWIGEVPCKTDYMVKVRHGAHMYNATVRIQNNNEAHIVLSEHDQGIAPGQFAVIYDGMECLGSGTIKESQ
jgi:tRNA (5-methylaminomethyl-2-thiouridylate)-methyltransferase